MHDIRDFIPLIFSQPGSLLYIGARNDAHSWLDELLAVGHRVIVLEVWQPNIDSLKDDSRIESIVHGDVRNIQTLFVGNFDYIFWWHGPEHIHSQEIPYTLNNLEYKINKIIALACPYGFYPQGAHEGNIYETHLTTLYPQYFKALGYTVKTDGEADTAGSEIVAWKAKKDE